MRRPSVQQIAQPLRGVAEEIAARLASAGHRAWIVGGAVRDLALEGEPLDIDMASAALPEEIEGLFERTIGVGRAFGTVIVHLRGLDVEVTTYRAEQGHSDGRRPDRVLFSTTLEADSARRDFTCNALYLDPLSDELADPQGGLGDLQARRLRCIGDPAERFREDALRLARMARLAGTLGFEVEPATFAAARQEAPGLARVSVERRLGELARVFEQPGSAEGFRLFVAGGLLRYLVPGQEALRPEGMDERQEGELRLAALRALGDRPGLAPGLALLLDPEPQGASGRAGALGAARQVLEGLRPSRHTRDLALGLWRLQREAERLLGKGACTRSERLRLLRDPLWVCAERLLRAWRIARGSPSEDLDELERFLAQVPREQRFPPALLTSEDLARSGLPRGRQWGRLLEEAESAQLDLLFSDREQALSWLAGRVAQLGGNTDRNDHDSG